MQKCTEASQSLSRKRAERKFSTLILERFRRRYSGRWQHWARCTQLGNFTVQVPEAGPERINQPPTLQSEI
jgi:hypothetical protein